jgi:hypothetical protein
MLTKRDIFLKKNLAMKRDIFLIKELGDEKRYLSDKEISVPDTTSYIRG